MRIRVFSKVIIALLILQGITAMFADIDSLLAPVQYKEKNDNQDTSSLSGIDDNDIQPRFVYQNQIIDRLSDLILQRYESKGLLKIRPDRNWKRIPINNGLWSIDLINVTPNKIDSRMVIHFRLNSGTKKVGEWQIPVQAELWMDVYTLTRPLGRGDSIDIEDVRVVTVNALKHQNPLVESDVDIENYEIYQSVHMENPLYWKNIRSIPMVRKGQIVDVVAHEGSLKITTKGQAMQDGARGELITIRNLKSRKDFQAQVINENAAKVFF